MDSMDQIHTFSIPETVFPTLIAKFDSLVKRAMKRGLNVPTLSVVGEKMGDWSIGGEIHHVKLVELEISTEILRLGEYTPVAILSWETTETPILKEFPGQNLPKSFWNVHSTRCDYCHKKQNRKRLFVVRGEDGSYSVVGSSCVRDFLGIDPTTIANSFLVLEEMGPFRRDALYHFPPDMFPLLSFLTTTAMSVRRFGYHKGASENPTWIDVSVRMNEQRGEEGVTDEDREMAQTVLKEALQIEPGSSSYLQNLLTLANGGMVGRDSYGLAVSMIPWYERLLHERKEKTSEFVGEVGLRITMEMKLESAMTFDGQWGMTTLHRMRDRAGNLLIWWASFEEAQFPVGEWVTVRGKVKKHSIFREEKQTILSHCKKVPALLLG